MISLLKFGSFSEKVLYQYAITAGCGTKGIFGGGHAQGSQCCEKEAVDCEEGEREVQCAQVLSFIQCSLVHFYMSLPSCLVIVLFKDIKT